MNQVFPAELILLCYVSGFHFVLGSEHITPVLYIVKALYNSPIDATSARFKITECYKLQSFFLHTKVSYRTKVLMETCLHNGKQR